MSHAFSYSCVKKHQSKSLKTLKKKIVNYLKQIPISIPHAATHILRFFLPKMSKNALTIISLRTAFLPLYIGVVEQ